MIRSHPFHRLFHRQARVIQLHDATAPPTPRQYCTVATRNTAPNRPSTTPKIANASSTKTAKPPLALHIRHPRGRAGSTRPTAAGTYSEAAKLAKPNPTNQPAGHHGAASESPLRVKHAESSRRSGMAGGTDLGAGTGTRGGTGL